MHIRRAIVLGFLVAALTPVARAEDLFPLTRYVPSSVLYMRAGRANPKHKEVGRAWRRYFTAVMESGALEELPEAQREALYKAVYETDFWKTKIGPQIPDLLDRDKMVITRIVPTPKSTVQ